MRRILPLAILAVLALPRLAGAQQVSIEVSVLDATTNAPLPGTTVDLKNIDTGAEATAVTDAQGVVRFGGLGTIGRYQASIAGNEENAAAISAELELRSQFDTNIILKVGKRADEPVYETVVSTTPAAFQLNRTNGEVSSTLRLRDVEKIPVEARSLDRALYRLPNVTQSTGFFAEAPVIAINGANALSTNYLIDGLDNNENFLGGMRFPVPVGMMQDVTVLAAGYGVEYGRTANGVVNVTSRGGGNEMKNEAFFVTRPGGIFTKDLPGQRYQLNSLYNNPVSSSFQRYQGGAIASGALVKDKTFYMVDIEYTADVTDNQLTSPDLGVNESINGNNNYLLMSARFDHKLDDNWTLTLRGNHGRIDLNNPGGGLQGGVTFPSAGSDQTRYSTNIAFTATRHSSVFDYTGSVQYSRFDWNYGKPKNGNGPQITIRNAATDSVIGVVGNNGSFFDDTENTVQTKHVFTKKSGRHTMKAGADAVMASFQLRGGGNPDGNFDVSLNPDQLATLQALNRGKSLDSGDVPGSAQVNSANYEGRPARIGRTQQLYGVFLEDSIQLTPTFVATFGVRWDFDSLSKAGNAQPDWNNVAPRASAAWSLSETFVLRGSSGLFYEKIPYTVTSDALQGSSKSAGYLNQLQQLKNQGVLPGNTNLGRVTYNGNNTLSATCATLAECPSGSAVRSGAGTGAGNYQELRIQNPNGLHNPYAWQSTLGAQWKFHPAFFASVDFILTYGYNLVRLRDLNSAAPYDFNGTPRSTAAANASRPTGFAADGTQEAGTARSIIVSETSGKSRYTAMNVTLYKQEWSDAFDFRIYYTLSRLSNNTDDLNFRATDANRYTREWGPSLNDRTHVISTIVNIYPIKRGTLTVASIIQSGQPYNLVPDGTVYGTQDLNGDGLSRSDQYTGNPDRAPGARRNSGRLNWGGTFDVGAAYDIPISYTRLRIRADVFNIFNAQNQSGYPVNYTVSNQVQTAGRPFQQTSTNTPRTAQFTAQWYF